MLKKIGVYAFLILAAFLSLFPFYFMFVSGTNTNAEILAAPPKLLPGSMLSHNFSILVEKMDIFRVAFNTLFISVVFTVLALMLYSAAGYVLAKFDFKGKGLIFSFIMVSMMIPPQVMYVPLFQLFVATGMTNTYTAVILPALANAFGIFLMRQNMMNFPTALVEAARIDGANGFRTVWDIILPLIRRSMMFVFVSNTVANLLMFVPMYMITLGGPEMSTNLMMYEAYKSGFIYADFGRSYAIVTLILLVSFAVVMVEMKVLKPKH